MSEGIDITFNEDKPVIKVIGIGGGGGNAVNYMYKQGICNVDFVICNTDKHALNKSPIPIKIQLGEKGLGAGNKPEIGRQAAIETLPKIKDMLEDSTEMVFITAGMGGGTGTGAAPVIAQAAKELGILTIGIISIPFLFEGRNRVYQAIEGVEEMRKHVDAILIINNEKIKSLYGDLSLSNAFSKADNVLTIAAKGIAEIITVTGYINVDLNDVKTVMTDSGDAIMGSARAAGQDRAVEAIKESLNSPLLLSTDIRGAKNILLNISYGVDEITMDEVSIVTDYLQKQVGPDTQIIWGATFDENLGDEVNVTIVATGFNLDKQTLSNHIQPVMNEQRAPAHEPQRINFTEPEKEKKIDVETYYGKSGGGLKNNSFLGKTMPDERKPMVALDLDDETGIDKMENIPAYKRKNQTEETTNDNYESLSSDEISRFSIRKDGDGFQLRDKNDFFNNVD
jgi:cell division protein FtsZ